MVDNILSSNTGTMVERMWYLMRDRQLRHLIAEVENLRTSFDKHYKDKFDDRLGHIISTLQEIKDYES